LRERWKRISPRATPRLEEIARREAQGLAALEHLEARASHDVLDVEHPVRDPVELEEAVVARGELGEAVPIASGPPAARVAQRVHDRRRAGERRGRPLEHVPLEEGGHPTVEELGVVVEDLAGSLEVLLTGAHRLELVLAGAVPLGEAVDEAVDPELHARRARRVDLAPGGHVSSSGALP
jgi:hypothetical protein